MVSRIGHVGLRVADLDRAVEHAVTMMGLREVERVDGVAYMTCNERHHELLLIADGEAGFDHLGLEVANVAELDRLRGQVAAAGFPIIDAPFAEQGIAGSFWCLGPGGFVFKLFAGMAHNQPARYSAPGIRPRKFAHITLKSNNLPEVEGFLVNQLGFRISDRMSTVLSWLRCNYDHHGIGLLADSQNMLHHYAFEMEGWASFAQLGDHFINHGKTFIWGPGRHGPGDNQFCYFFDPDGFVAEYMADILRIDDEATYRWRDWPDLPVTINQYGPAAPPEFFAAGVPVAKRYAPADV
jgi:catechol-2,3-dioxygenase